MFYSAASSIHACMPNVPLLDESDKVNRSKRLFTVYQNVEKRERERERHY